MIYLSIHCPCQHDKSTQTEYTRKTRSDYKEEIAQKITFCKLGQKLKKKKNRLVLDLQCGGGNQ